MRDGLNFRTYAKPKKRPEIKKSPDSAMAFGDF
jgi:hypothetical protein